MDNIYPNNPTAEKALLGCCLIDPEAVIKLQPTADIFFSERNAAIMQAMLDLAAKNQPIDFVTLMDQLEANQTDIQPSEITELMGAVPSALNGATYLAIVIENAGRRAYIKTAQTILDLATDTSLDLATIETKAQAAVFAQRRATTAGAQSIASHITATINELEIVSNSDTPVGVATGLANLDAILAGLAPGDLIIGAGRPGMGKTAFALTAASNIARRGQRVVFYSLEMTARQCTHRMIAAETGIPTQRLRNGIKEPEEWQAVIDAASDIYTWNMVIDDTPSLHIDTLMANLRNLAAEAEIAIVFVDYLQLLRATPTKNSNREQDISHISQCLKATAKELKFPIFALAQLSRAVETRADKRPMLSDLRESGAIEQNADVVMFWYRDDYYNSESETPGVTETIVAKHRNGATGNIPLFFDKERTRFQDIQILRTELEY